MIMSKAKNINEIEMTARQYFWEFICIEIPNIIQIFSLLTLLGILSSVLVIKIFIIVTIVVLIVVYLTVKQEIFLHDVFQNPYKNSKIIDWSSKDISRLLESYYWGWGNKIVAIVLGSIAGVLIASVLKPIVVGH